MRRSLSVFALVLFATVLSARPTHCANAAAGTTPLVLQGIAIVDVEKGVVRSPGTVVISADTIGRIVDGPPIDLPEDARVVDGTGLYLMPGLFDAHVHYVDPVTFGPLMIANGVLFVRDMGNPTSEILVLRDNLRGGAVFGPEMVATGAMLDGNPPTIPAISIPCGTPDEGRAAVRAQVIAGVDQIKVYSGLKEEVFLAIADEAATHHVDVVGHIPEVLTVEEAADAGMKSSEHLFGFGKIVARLLGEPMELATGGMGKDVPYFLRLHEVRKHGFQSALARLRSSGMHVCPTLVVFQQGARRNEIFAGRGSLMEYASPTVKGIWKAVWGSQPENEIVPRLLSPMKEITCEIQKSGIPMMVGTDLLSPGVTAGFSVHEEMVLWQEGGIPPAEILRSATIVPARFMGVADRLGTIAEGKTASLVLLRGNPLADVHNAAQIEGVVLRGRYFSRADLDGLLDDVRRVCRQGAEGGERQQGLRDVPSQVTLTDNR
jgi:imidazolonepropionase-like amidohydrolase